jgi:hypothetical protein
VRGRARQRARANGEGLLGGVRASQGALSRKPRNTSGAAEGTRALRFSSERAARRAAGRAGKRAIGKSVWRGRAGERVGKRGSRTWVGGGWTCGLAHEQRLASCFTAFLAGTGHGYNRQVGQL